MSKKEELLKEQENRIYIKEALEAMKSYSEEYLPNCGYFLLPDNLLLLSTYSSCFKLYSQELYQVYSGAVDRGYPPLKLIGALPDAPKYLSPKDQDLEWIDGSLDGYSTVISKDLEKESEDSNIEVYRVKSIDDTIGVCVKKDIIDFAEAILGKDTAFLLEKKQNREKVFTLRAQSKKGKGFIISA